MPERRPATERRALLARLLADEAARPRKAAASPGQERLWLAMRAAPGSPVYNCPLTLEVRGALVPESLEWALQALVTRHEALRTTFVEEEGELFQVIAPTGRAFLERLEAAGADREARRTAARTLARSFARAPFDLTRGPLYRFALVRVDADECFLLLNAHHLVSDGWSQGILLRELLVLYRARAFGTSGELPRLPIQYADVARWARSERERRFAASSEALASWKGDLESAASLRLPLDFVRPPVPTTAGARVSVELSPASLAHARAVSAREGASLFQVVLAAFEMVLALWCHQERFVVGTPAHNRDRSEMEGVVGFFVSTVPMVVDLEGEPTIVEAFRRLRDSSLRALAHADVPFERLVSAAGTSGRVPGAPPLVQALFVWQQDLMPELELAETEVRAYEEETGTSKFDLTLSLRPEGERIVGFLELNRDLFEPRTIARLVAPIERMLETMDRSPELPFHCALAELADSRPEIFSELERVGTGPALPSSGDTASLYARAVILHAGRPAVDSETSRLTYAELDSAASALAAVLRDRGHREGEPVGLCLETGAEAIVGIVAAWKRASPYVPIDPSWPEDRVDHILSETGARWRLVRKGGRGELSREIGVDLRRLLDPVCQRIQRGRIGARPEDLAYIIYTSGSTGEPKGVLIPHGAVAHLDRALDDAVFGSMARSTGRPLRVGVFGALTFDTTVKGLIRLFRGDCLCPVPQELKRSPALLARFLGAAFLDVVDMTPSWLRILIDAGLEAPLPRTFLLGGECIDPVLWHDLALRQARGEARFVNLYGPTEATVDATSSELAADREPSIGRPLANTRVWILDESSRPVPPGFPGEIAIASEGLAPGYLDRPVATATAFVDLSLPRRSERVYKTGDYGRFRGDDRLVFLGRRDRQVKRHGQRLELDEVEAALYSHPHVSEAAVVFRDGRLSAVCVAKGNRPEDEDVAAHAARILPRGFLPDAYHWCDSLPHNASGKIDYRALATADLPEAARARTRTRSRATSFLSKRLQTEGEKLVAEIWTELLGAPPGDPRADFFASGGDSLLGLRLLARVEQRLGVPLDVAWLASSPTFETLAAACARNAGAERERLLWLQQRSTEAAPLFLVHATGGDVRCYRSLATLLMGHSIAGVLAPPLLPGSLRELASVHRRSVMNALGGGRRVLLGGWSLGGVIALEIARELREHGIEVPLVLMLDSRLPRASSVSSTTEPIAVGREETGVLERATASSLRLLDLWREHAPARYEGNAFLLRASSGRPENDDSLSRWREVLPHLSVVHSPVEHEEMMRPPQVAKVALIVQRSLDELRRRSSAAPEPEPEPLSITGAGI